MCIRDSNNTMSWLSLDEGVGFKYRNAMPYSHHLDDTMRSYPRRGHSRLFLLEWLVWSSESMIANPNPASDQQKSTKRSDGSQPPRPTQGQTVQTPTEQADTECPREGGAP
eukprot:TRINITY_DN20226_c0_g1_i9.p3 TRINITY_DN20226_c0_g1~~TRINITY_DN20226_c0_g1_i9.p3  ORF type:complete len:111 (+),score=8.92 TRINITY_DN20226_c0_g1_i9:143-475(+)